MREILFRGKRIDNGEWVEGHYHCANWYLPPSMKIVDTTHHILPIGHGDSHKVDPKTVGQYSGMNDTDMVPIFDGCVLRFGRILSGTLKAVRAVVRFENGAFIVEYRPGAWDYLNIIQDPFKVRACKVIGNIYDNPELLEVTGNA